MRTLLIILLALALSGCSLSSSFTVAGDYAGQSYSYTVKGE